MSLETHEDAEAKTPDLLAQAGQLDDLSQKLEGPEFVEAVAKGILKLRHTSAGERLQEYVNGKAKAKTGGVLANGEEETQLHPLLRADDPSFIQRFIEMNPSLTGINPLELRKSFLIWSAQIGLIEVDPSILSLSRWPEQAFLDVNPKIVNALLTVLGVPEMIQFVDRVRRVRDRTMTLSDAVRERVQSLEAQGAEAIHEVETATREQTNKDLGIPPTDAIDTWN